MIALSANNVIIGITCIISFFALNNENLMYRLLHRPYDETRSNQWYRLLSSGFIHADIFHLFVNMFVLYQFGAYVEYRFVEEFGSVGSYMYAGFYLLVIVLASLKTHFQHKDNYQYSALGASGATSGVLFSFILFEPLSTLGLYMVIPVPAILFGVLYLWYSSWAAKKGGDNIGHDAHFYGAIAGLVLTILLFKGIIPSFLASLKQAF